MHDGGVVRRSLGRPHLALGEVVTFCTETFFSNWRRFALTALGMVIGTASLIWVVTIGMAGKQYVLQQIESIGVNWVFAEYQGGAEQAGGTADPLTIRDYEAVLQQVPGIAAGSPILEIRDQMSMGIGHMSPIYILGVFPGYVHVRNLLVLSGRAFDEEDLRARSKVAVITVGLARQLFGSNDAAIGHNIKLSGLPFTVIGIFKERVDTFGQSEVYEYTMLVPYSSARLLTNSDQVKQLYFSVAEPSMVIPSTNEIRTVLQSRHRPESTYWVSNLTKLMSVANKSANALTMVLLLIAGVTLLVSGLGIMNIMLATVIDRTREIGIRKAVGATRSEICLQFIAEALLISFLGGTVGIAVGLSIPYSIRLLTNYDLPISGMSVVVGLAVSAVVGITAGTLPAVRAARMDPVESLRHE